MRELTSNDFSSFFEALWGYPPFAWQSDLADRVLRADDRAWPEVIKLPTASGKTACLDIAIFALASQAGRIARREPMSAAKRVFFVVDRRVIVDEAFARARRLATKLGEASDGIVLEVAERLRAVADGPIPLECYELRGGMYRSDAWARSPRQPTIIASTVDQIGSRLLFRSYGRSPKSWPLHAGLAGNDSLVLLDEAHCAQPFMETLRAVGKYRAWAEIPIPSPFGAVVMSATPPDSLRDVFEDKSAEPRDPKHPLGRRQLAHKPARLCVVAGAKGRKSTAEMAKSMAAAAADLVCSERLAVVVFANRVATARETARLLFSRHGDRVVLLTGRMRPFDKDDVIAEKLALVASATSATRALSEPLFVVATQTLEVGADLDFDALVTECASLDALRQRFGRLNRMGRNVAAHASIHIRADQMDASGDDPVYGPSISTTWNWLKTLAGADEVVDFQIAAINAAIPSDGAVVAALAAPTAHAPILLPTHIDCLAQTMPTPVPSPDPSVFLHGPVRGSADLHVCWRADIDLRDRDSISNSLDLLALCPPSSTECLSVPPWILRRWLEGGDVTDSGADVEGESAEPDRGDERSGDQSPAKRCIVWRGRGEAAVVDDTTALRPGDVVVLPASAGEAETLGDLVSHGSHGPVMDCGDRAFAQARTRAILRLNASVIAELPSFRSRARLAALCADARERWAEDADELMEELRSTLDSVAADATAPSWLRETAASLGGDPKLKRNAIPHPFSGLVLRGSRVMDHARIREAAAGTTDEDDVSSSATVDVPLLRHLEGVGKRARMLAEGCSLPGGIRDAVVIAARLHDLGKADPRFQALLRGGIPGASGDLLAKSGRLPQGRIEFERVRSASGYPEGGRHELLSVRLIESDPALLPNDTVLADLVKHLVESHHGHCRPFAPVVADDSRVAARVVMDGRALTAETPTRMDHVDSGAGERFWSLTRRFGWWGLAWLEAIVRLADHRQSEDEEHGTERMR